MDSRVRASAKQFLELLEYMESQGDLTKPQTGAQGRLRSDRLWAELTNILNDVRGGVKKTTDKWKKVWADLKSKTKKKALIIRRHESETGGEPASHLALTVFEKRVLAVMGSQAIDGQISIEELVFNRSQSSAPLPLSPPVAKDTLHLELTDEESSKDSLQASTPHPNSRILPSTSQTATQMVRPNSPPRPISSQERPNGPGRAITQRRKRVPVSHASASLSGRRRQRLTAVPQSAASVRPRVRLPRRPVLIPFRRAAGDFMVLELRRLELEETRARQQHEREMRALDIEHDRNQVFHSLVAIAQDWLDYYRSRTNT